MNWLSPRQSCGNIAAVRILLPHDLRPNTAGAPLDTATRQATRAGAAVGFCAGRRGKKHQALTQQSMPNVNQFTLAGGVVFHL
jgi:hypothetical protein